jgi:hypothetical protein
MSEYEKLREKGLGRGRPKLTDEQKAQSQALNSARQEARRRAHLVLKNRYSDEFAEIYERELSSIVASGTTRKRKTTRK